MNDPASAVQQQLLPHLHLVSKHRFPMTNQLSIETALEYLLSAPKIVRDLQPMQWNFLDSPQDGTIILVWQPLNHLGTNFASDGYIWADAESAFRSESRGYTIEMYVHRCGYHPPEQLASHCRRRFRLVPSGHPGQNQPPVDPSLWIVHYSKAPPNDNIPVNRIPLVPTVQSMMAQRRFLQSQGILPRREFMLHDRNNWPAVNFPNQAGQPSVAQPAGPYPAALARQQQGPFFQPTTLPRKAPRDRHSTAAINQSMAIDPSLEDENVSNIDPFDTVRAQDTSRMRFQQHQQWMEEILDSPFNFTSQIVPPSLGLGRAGELETLTAGFFDTPSAPSTANKDATKDANKDGNKDDKGSKALSFPKMEPGKADEFADRVAKHVADVNAEMEEMKKQHAKRVEQFRRSVFKDAQQQLREAVTDPSDLKPNKVDLETCYMRPAAEDDGSSGETEQWKPKYKISDIVQEVESATAMKITPAPRVACVQKGGLLEKIEHEEPAADKDVSMGNADGDLLAQIASTDVSAPAPQTSQPAAPQPGLPADVDMGEATQMTAPASAEGETGDWVMVNETPKEPITSGDSMNVSGAEVAPGGLQGLTPGGTLDGVRDSGLLETSNFDDAADFSNIDSAGDALAAYSEQHDGLDLEGLEDSAFGDAFHASDNENTHHPDTEDLA